MVDCLAWDFESRLHSCRLVCLALQPNKVYNIIYNIIIRIKMSKYKKCILLGLWNFISRKFQSKSFLFEYLRPKIGTSQFIPGVVWLPSAIKLDHVSGSTFSITRARARIMEIGGNYQMASRNRAITFLKNNLSDFERRGNLIIVIYSNTVVTPLCCLVRNSTFSMSTMFSLVLAIWKFN
jgi:hypothetical protein